MAGRVQAQGHAVVQQALAVGQGLQVDVLAQAAAQNAGTGAGGQIMAIAGACVVAVAMGDHGAVHGPPGVDVEIAGRAVQAFGAGDDKVHGTGTGLGLPVRSMVETEVRMVWAAAEKGFAQPPCTRSMPYRPGTKVSRWLPYARRSSAAAAAGS
jgi:hypothetical protein